MERKKYVPMRKGFTLIELMVVLVILGMLATFMGPRVLSYPDQARMTKAKNDMLAIDSALKMYKIDTGTFPTTEQGLDALLTQPTIDPVPKGWRPGGYLDTSSTPTDPWGGAFIYRSPSDIDGLDYELTSRGADGKEGGEDYDADIMLHELR